MSIVCQCIQFLRSSCLESRFIGAERNVSYDNATSNLGYPKIPNTYFVISRTVRQAEKGVESGYSVVRFLTDFRMTRVGRIPYPTNFVGTGCLTCTYNNHKKPNGLAQPFGRRNLASMIAHPSTNHRYISHKCQHALPNGPQARCILYFVNLLYR